MFATITSYLNKTEKNSENRQEANDFFRVFFLPDIFYRVRVDPVRTLKVIIQIATKNLLKND